MTRTCDPFPPLELLGLNPVLPPTGISSTMLKEHLFPEHLLCGHSADLLCEYSAVTMVDPTPETSQAESCSFSHSRRQVGEATQVELGSTEVLDVELLIPDIENSFMVRFVCAYVCECARECVCDRAALWSWSRIKKVWETKVWADLGFVSQREGSWRLHGGSGRDHHCHLHARSPTTPLQ